MKVPGLFGEEHAVTVTREGECATVALRVGLPPGCSVPPDLGSRLSHSERVRLDERGELDRETVATLCARAGREVAPALLWELHQQDVLSRAAYYEVAEVWSATEFPLVALDGLCWFELFEIAGYTVDGERAERPSEPLTLYRGAAADQDGWGWSWTDSPAVAQFFASGDLSHLGRPAGRVYVASVEPWALLARTNGRSESEYVVCPDGLRGVRPWEGIRP